MAIDFLHKYFDEIFLIGGNIFIIGFICLIFREIYLLIIEDKKFTYRLRYKHPDCKINFKEGTYNYFWVAKIAKKIYSLNYPNRKYWISKSERY
jgi:hypothetical protein